MTRSRRWTLCNTCSTRTRREGSWLIAARTGNAVWWSGNPAVLGLEGVPNAFPRHEGHLSPAWLGS